MADLTARMVPVEHRRHALAAERRRLPMVKLDPATYTFTAPDGSAASFADLFGGHRQLVIYHFMLEPGQDWICGGCATFTDNLDNQSQPHLNAPAPATAGEPGGD